MESGSSIPSFNFIQIIAIPVGQKEKCQYLGPESSALSKRNTDSNSNNFNDTFYSWLAFFFQTITLFFFLKYIYIFHKSFHFLWMTENFPRFSLSTDMFCLASPFFGDLFNFPSELTFVGHIINILATFSAPVCV